MDEIAVDMDGQRSGEGADVEGGDMMFDIDLDAEVNLDSNGGKMLKQMGSEKEHITDTKNERT
jgi:hypothetical protein